MDPSNVVTSVTDTFLQQGVLGAIYLLTIVPLAWWAKKQAEELKCVMEHRATDAQQTVDKLLALNDKWNSTVGEQLRALETINATLDGIRDLLVRDRTP